MNRVCVYVSIRKKTQCETSPFLKTLLQNYSELLPPSLLVLSTCLDRTFVIWLSFKSLLEVPIFCWQGLLYVGVQRGETKTEKVTPKRSSSLGHALQSLTTCILRLRSFWDLTSKLLKMRESGLPCRQCLRPTVALEE